MPLPPLEAAELNETGAATAADGLYLLTLGRTREEHIVANRDPNRRTEVDPLLDRQRQLTARVLAHRVSVPGVDLSTDRPRPRTGPVRCSCRCSTPRSRTRSTNTSKTRFAVALVAVQGARVLWADGRCVRRGLGPAAPGLSLFESTRAAMVDALNELGPELGPEPLATAFAAACPLDFLPPSGQLPAVALYDAAKVPAAGQLGPRIPFLEPHLDLELEPVRLGDVSPIVERELARGPVERTRATGERLRLLVAVGDASYRRDLLDVPSVSTAVIDALHGTWVVAAEAWVAWKNAQNERDFVKVVAGIAAFPNDAKITLTAAQLAALGLAQAGAPFPKEEGPEAQGGLGLVEGIIARERAETAANGEPELPRPYSAPPPAATFSVWAQGRPEQARATAAKAEAARAVAGTDLPPGTIPDLLVPSPLSRRALGRPGRGRAHRRRPARSPSRASPAARQPYRESGCHFGWRGRRRQRHEACALAALRQLRQAAPRQGSGAVGDRARSGLERCAQRCGRSRARGVDVSDNNSLGMGTVQSMSVSINAPPATATFSQNRSAAIASRADRQLTPQISR